MVGRWGRKPAKSELSAARKETSELGEWTELDRRRRALEYCIHSEELKRANEELEALDAAAEGGASASANNPSLPARLLV